MLKNDFVSNEIPSPKITSLAYDAPAGGPDRSSAFLPPTAAGARLKAILRETVRGGTTPRRRFDGRPRDSSIAKNHRARDIRRVRRVATSRRSKRSCASLAVRGRALFFRQHTRGNHARYIYS